MWNKSGIKTQVVKTTSLRALEVEQMLALMGCYYQHIDRLTFVRDLFEKTHVILLRQRRSCKIVGFSTIKMLNIKIGEQDIDGLFSGDTVVDQAYWGRKDLGRCFLKFMLLQKLKRPFRPFYWFLISKGYKTYILMANNFKVHYPRHEVETPQKFSRILSTVYGQLFGPSFIEETGLIRMKNGNYVVKINAAKPKAIDTQNERIAYFVRKNPNWNVGEELACVAEMELMLPLRYSLKALIQALRKWRRKLLHAGLENAKDGL